MLEMIHRMVGASLYSAPGSASVDAMARKAGRVLHSAPARLLKTAPPCWSGAVQCASRATVLVALGLAPLLVGAGARAAAPRPAATGAPDLGPAPITLPIEYSNQHVFLVLNDERSRPLTFMLDTGFENSSLSRAGAGSRQINWIGTIKPNGYGDNRSEQWYGKVGIVLRSGHTDLFRGSVLVLDLNSMRSEIGHPIDGVLGWDIFSQWCTTLDIGARRLTLREPSACSTPQGAEREIQSQWLPHGLLLPSTITFAGGRQVRAMLHLDTGCDTALMLNDQFREISGIGKPGVASYPIGSWGVNGASMADRVAVSSIELDGGALRIPATKETTVVIQRPGGVARAHWWNSGFQEARLTRDGLLGTEVLERFTWTFDPLGKSVYIAPRAERPTESAASRAR